MPKKFRHRFFERLIPWSVPIVLILVWQFLSQVGWLSSRTLPAPTAVFQAGVEDVVEVLMC